MTTAITEWEFTADVVGWINSIINEESTLAFSAAKTEQRTQGSQKRRDVTLLDRKGNPVVTGEIKLPDRADGGTPFNAAVVKDARAKALRANVPYFFTWNVNTCVLWETSATNGALHQQNFRIWKVAQVHKSSALHQQATQMLVRKWLRTFLLELGTIVRGEEAIGVRSPDQKFMEALEAALEAPIRFTIDELTSRYSKTAFKKDLDTWMRGDQGWTIYNDPSGIEENLERAAKFSCYSLVIKLVFYEALLKRFGTRLKKIVVPAHIDAGDDLRIHLEGYFDRARKVTGDYETVFGEHARSIGARIPFYAEGAVPHWGTLINSIHEFDFSKLDYEVVGSIFERLIDPSERHKYGQYYTRVEIVDLINSFAIRDGTETVMDPACGGGTFLVRAYGRKRELAPGRGHTALLGDLYGVDMSHFATHLTTINLATRDLIDDENYPQVGRSDFFDVHPQKSFISLPKGVKARGLGKIQHRPVIIPPLDAIVGNPPYVRQEDIPKAKRKAQKGTKDHYQSLVEHEAGVKLSGRSDLHVYFWPHAASFLKPDGYVCFLTSSQWLDVDYGFRLQQWILENFEIVAVMESIDEPWFVGARVATVATIIRRQSHPAKRASNNVRFVQFLKPIHELTAHDGTTGGAIASADALRDELLGINADAANDRYRVRIVKQGKLLEDGVRLGALMSGESAGEEEETDTDEVPSLEAAATPGRYYGGKWGVYIRGPQVWFDLLKKFESRLTMLGDIASVRFGMKTGKDAFFYPKDVSEECLVAQPDPKTFALEYDVPRKDVASGKVRIVACGDKLAERKLIEAKYLEPEIHSLMEIEHYAATAAACSRQVLLVPGKKASHANEYALDYIKWGERNDWHELKTCAGRATKTREWYDLTDSKRAVIILPKIQQYRLMAFLNPDNLYQNSSLLGLYDVPEKDALLLCAVLNSTVALLSRLTFARILGNEGTVQLDVYSAKMMLVPDIRQFANAPAKQRALTAFNKMLSRQALSFVSDRRRGEMTHNADLRGADLHLLSNATELDMADRQELDDAVLELLGATETQRYQIRKELYVYFQQFFEATRRKEELAIANRNATRHRSVARPADLATAIADEVVERYPHLLKSYDDGFFNEEMAFDTYEVPANGAPVAVQSLFVPHGIVFGTGKKEETLPVKVAEQVPLLILLAEQGHRGYVRVPRSPDESKKVETEFRAFVADRERILARLVDERTGDEGLQAAIRSSLESILARRGDSHSAAAIAS